MAGIATGEASAVEIQAVLTNSIKVSLLLQQYVQGDAGKAGSKDVAGFATHANVDAAVEALRVAIVAYQAVA